MVGSINAIQLAVQQAQGSTVGVVPPDGSVQPRLEIDDFIQDADLVNFYRKMPFSYFQTAGARGADS